MVLYYARGSETDIITESELEDALKEVYRLLGDRCVCAKVGQRSERKRESWLTFACWLCMAADQKWRSFLRISPGCTARRARSHR